MDVNNKAVPFPVKRLKSSTGSENMANAFPLALPKQQTVLEEAVQNAVHIVMKDVTQCIQSLTSELQLQMAVVHGLIASWTMFNMRREA